MQRRRKKLIIFSGRSWHLGLPRIMKILSWNCRGMSNPREIPNLRALAQKYHPDIPFLSETLANSQKLERVRVSLKFESCLSVVVVGKSGRIIVLWNNSKKCSVMIFHRNYVNLIVHDDEKGDWRLTCYYGYPGRQKRRQAWNMIRELHSMSTLPWCIIGDSNDWLSHADKRGLHTHPNWLALVFEKWWLIVILPIFPCLVTRLFGLKVGVQRI